MAYYGDIRLGATIDIKFPTRNTSQAMTTLSGSPVISAYVGNSTTQITSGITLSVDFDGITGLNNVRVVASSGNGFATATDIDLVITAGTVGGISVIGEVVGSFSIENRSALMAATSGRTLVVDASGLADANTVKLGPSGSGTAQTARDIGASVLLSNGTGTGQLKLASGYVAMTWADIAAPTTAVNLSGTTISTSQVVASIAGVTFPTNFGDLSISATTGLVDITQVAADKVWSTATRTLTSPSGLGFPTNFSALLINASGHISRVTLTDTLTTYTGNTPQTGDSYARIGANGAGLTAIPWNAAWDAEVQSEVTDALTSFGVSTLTGTDVENAVWDAVLADHLDAGSTGFALNAAGSAGDPWGTALPGAYGAGSAGYIIGTNLDATVSSRLATAGYTAPLSAAGTRTALGMAAANLDAQIDGVNANINGVQQATITKNSTGYIQFPMVLSSDHYTPATGKTVTGQRSFDGASYSAVSGTITEIGSGVYAFNYAAGDSNGDSGSWLFSATDCDNTLVPFITSE